MHDDRAIEADHFIGRGGAGQRGQVVVAGDHVAPPGFLDVALELDAERAVIPEAVEAAVDFARLKQEASPLAQRDEFVHFHAEYLLELAMPPLRVRHGLGTMPISFSLMIKAGMGIGKWQHQAGRARSVRDPSGSLEQGGQAASPTTGSCTDDDFSGASAVAGHFTAFHNKGLNTNLSVGEGPLVDASGSCARESHAHLRRAVLKIPRIQRIPATVAHNSSSSSMNAWRAASHRLSLPAASRRMAVACPVSPRIAPSIP